MAYDGRVKLPLRLILLFSPLILFAQQSLLASEIAPPNKLPSQHIFAVVAHAALADQQGSVVVLDARTGKTVAVERSDTASRRVAAPGSTIKPFVLRELLRTGKLRPHEHIACRRTVRLSGRNFDCVHAPVPEPMTAETALAYSCNSYFAEVASRLTPAELQRALRSAGFGNVALAQTPEEQTLEALGDFGVKVAPVQLARAYQQLASTLSSSPEDAAVRSGLLAATDYGMARLASAPRVSVAGKTGTSVATEGTWTHGWFAGFAPAESPHIVVVVFLERGQGRDAAAIAGKIFTALRSEQPADSSRGRQ